MSRIKKKHQGLSADRYKNNPLEKRFAEEWQLYNEARSHDTLAYLLDPSGQLFDPIEPSKNDRRVANTVIQWLGSPIGMHFVLGVLVKDKTAVGHMERMLREKEA